ncbi:MAG TPA: hypothetical protein PK264_17410 [Hyphomicrobiaceae bacterium]|nr:hypothetical protein [Hyphomicrobiaceae bacterium]
MYELSRNWDGITSLTIVVAAMAGLALTFYTGRTLVGRRSGQPMRNGRTRTPRERTPNVTAHREQVAITGSAGQQWDRLDAVLRTAARRTRTASALQHEAWQKIDAARHDIDAVLLDIDPLLARGPGGVTSSEPTAGLGEGAKS